MQHGECSLAVCRTLHELLTCVVGLPGLLVCMHHHPALVAQEPVDGVVLVHGCDAGILSGHLRLKLQEGRFPDLPEGIFNLDCLQCTNDFRLDWASVMSRLKPWDRAGENATKGHLAQNGGDDG